MQDIEKELYEQIKPYFECDKRHVSFIVKLIIGLMKLGESSLSKWSKAIGGDTEISSKYRRLQRFLSYFRFSSRLYFLLVWALYGQDREVYLSLDRSEWKMRGVWVQVLMLSIVYEKVSIPLLWHCSSRHGHSSLLSKRALLRCLDKWLTKTDGQKIWLCADREFGCKLFFEDCQKVGGVYACVRLKKNTIVWYSKTPSPVYRLFDNGCKTSYKKPVKFMETSFFSKL